MTVENHFDSEADLRRYEALLEMADLMVHHRSLPEWSTTVPVTDVELPPDCALALTPSAR